MYVCTCLFVYIYACMHTQARLACLNAYEFSKCFHVNRIRAISLHVHMCNFIRAYVYSYIWYVCRCGVAKYVRLRQEFQEKEEHMREDVEKMRREFEEVSMYVCFDTCKGIFVYVCVCM